MRLPDGAVRKRRKSYDDLTDARELTFSCYRKLKLLNSDRTRLWLIESIERARSRLGFEIWAWVIMPEHAHLLVAPTSPACTFAAMTKTIKQPVAQRAIAWLKRSSPAFLERLRIGPGSGQTHRFWQAGGGYDRNLWSGDAIWNSVEYIHNNPVKRRLVKDQTDWEWSSARWYAGRKDGPLPPDRMPPVWRTTKTY